MDNQETPEPVDIQCFPISERKIKQKAMFSMKSDKNSDFIISIKNMPRFFIIDAKRKNKDFTFKYEKNIL